MNAAQSDALMHLTVILPVALALSMTRWIGFMAISPVFTRAGANQVVRAGFAFAMALPVLPGTMRILDAIQADRLLLEMGFLTAKELCVGAALGLITGIPFWGAEMAGEALDVQRGTTAGTIADPQGMNQASVLGNFFGILSVALFLIVGGIDIVVAALYDSYRLWPIDAFRPVLNIPIEAVFLGLLQKLTVIAVSVAAPLIIAMMSGDALLGFTAKLAPQLALDQLGAAVKSLILTVMLVIYCVVFPDDLTRVAFKLKTVITDIEAVSHEF